MKTILIIGASSGIGLHLASQLAEAGHHVVGTFHTHPVNSSHENLHFIHYNVLDNKPLHDLPEIIDAMVYCPGSIVLKPFARVSAAEFEHDFKLNVGGAINTIQAALPALKKSEHASIVLMSSVAASVGLNYHAVVASSKGAIEGLTRALAAELAPKIRVNAVALSLTDTPLAEGLLNSDQKVEANAQRHPLKRIGTTQDAANMISFLVSDQSAWVSGQIFHVDGGISSLKV
ncbi:MAG TPA: SDR family oxidoreductase [Chitinophagaceae bacterium]|nr:SDR family oxidoreductase [Chitinophagaceae bacterium]